MKTIVLLSGGPDSAVALYQAYKESQEVLAFTVALDHRGTNVVEVECARRLTARLGVSHTVANFGFTRDLLGDVPQTRLALGGQINSCPKRGTRCAELGVEFMHVGALLFAVNHKAERVVWSIHSDDLGASTADEVRNYLMLMNHMTELRTKRPSKLEAPFLNFSKSEVLTLGERLSVPFEDTFSCNDSETKVHCGVCDQCQKRFAAFSMAGIHDPARFNGVEMSGTYEGATLHSPCFGQV